MAAGLFGKRVDVGQLNQAAIQPTGIPGSTFVRAPQREAGGNLRVLADALGGLNSALQNFGAVKAQQERDPKSLENQEWEAKRQQMSLAELTADAEAGTANGIRVRIDAQNALLGERANDDFRQKWLEFYNTEFDQTSGNAEAEYERLRSEYAERLPNEIARGSFYRLTSNHFQSWMEKDVETKVNHARSEMHTTIVSGFRNALDDARGNGITDPKELARIVFEKSAGNRPFLGLSGQEQNATIFQMAQELAQAGEEDLVRELLAQPRTGAGGKKIGPLIGTSDYSVKASQLIEQAGKIKDEKARERSLPEQNEVNRLVAAGEFTEKEAEKRRGSGIWSDQQLSAEVNQSNNNAAQIKAKAAVEEEKRVFRQDHFRARDGALTAGVNAMSRVGGINDITDVEIPNATGMGTQTYSRDAIVKDTLDHYEQEFSARQQALIDQNVPPDQAKLQIDRQRMEFYSGQHVVNDKWRNTLNGMAGRATIDFQQRKGEVSGYLRQTAALYRQLKEINPSYLGTVLTDNKSREFFEIYDSAISMDGMSEDEALSHAAMTLSSPILQKAKNQLPDGAVAKITKSVLGGWGGLGADGGRSYNEGIVAEQVRRMSRNGMLEPEIRERLRERLAQRTVPINGVLVSTTHETTPDFPDLIQDELEARFKNLGERYGVSDPSDLTVVADGSETKWVVVDKTTGLQVGAELITLSTLNDHRRARKANQDKIEADRQSATEATRLKAQEAWKAEVGKRKERIAHWRRLEAEGGRFKQVYAGKTADDLQQRLDAFVATGRAADEATAKRTKDRQNRLQRDAQKNADELGFSGR